MATVSQYQQSTFTSPDDGQPRSADAIRANDEALRAKHNSHDADATIHVQSSLLASRPAAGTAGRLWLTTDSGSRKLWYDTGSAWAVLDFAALDGADFTGDVSITGALSASASIGTAGALSVTGTTTLSGAVTASSTINGQTISSAANLTGTLAVGTSATIAGGTGGAETLQVGGTLGVSGSAGVGGSLSVTGTATAATFSGSGASLTALPAAQLSGTVPSASLNTSYTAIVALTASGTITGGALTTAGAVSCATLGATGNATIGGTLAVTGVLTFDETHTVGWLQVNLTGGGTAVIPVLY